MEHDQINILETENRGIEHFSKAHNVFKITRDTVRVVCNQKKRVANCFLICCKNLRNRNQELERSHARNTIKSNYPDVVN